MSPLFTPLLLVAAGSIALFARHNRAAIVGLLLQWAGLAVAVAYKDGSLSLTRTALVEVGGALSCTAIFWLTLNAIERDNSRIRSAQAPISAADYFLPGAVLLLGGIAGVGLAILFPLGSQPEVDLALYWALISGALLVILEAARNPVMLVAGLFAILNSAALMLYTVSPTPPGEGAIGLGALVRIGIALVLAFLWTVLASTYGELSLEPLFNARSGETSTALVPVVSSVPGLDDQHDLDQPDEPAQEDQGNTSRNEEAAHEPETIVEPV